MSDTLDITRLKASHGDWIGPEELHDILAEEGYSAGTREQYLKSILTEMSKIESDPADNREKREALMREVRNILSQEQGKQGQTPMSDDV